ncbi:MAG: type II toxin-antitoxin system VapC family toxin [Verrucomicrobia bacterium]|nr:type II toxin-antitoxin system VapC family toxin [Verrucomicrobiota bacterium]
MPTVVDSSGWIEFFVGGSNADRFEKAIANAADLVVPAISITEVYRWVLRESSQTDALTVATLMRQGKIIPLDERLAVVAAEVSHRHRLSLADGIIYATALETSARLLTQDANLEGLPGVTYVPVPHPARKS